MNDWTNEIVYHVGSGHVYFSGAALILLAIASSFGNPGRWRSLTRNLLVLAGGLAVAISATPLSWASYAVLASLTICWLLAEIAQPNWTTRRKTFIRFLLALVWVAHVGIELPYHVMPVVPATAQPTLFVIGDSVSAGMQEKDPDTWPNVLARKQTIQIHDFSRMGATVKSARKQAERIGERTGLVLLEIGGNDLLGSTTPESFEEQLDLLLADVCQHERTVVMLELPLMPFANRFGMIQRRLAGKYQVILVPKRFFLSILTTRGATVDGIHPSRAGHVLMADRVWELIREGGGDRASRKPTEVIREL